MINKIWVCLTGFSFFLSVQACPLGMGFTTTRIALLILSIQLILRFSYDIRTEYPYKIFIPFISSSIAFIVSATSFIIVGGKMWNSMSWLLLGLLGTLISMCTYNIKLNNIKVFIKLILICEVIFFFIILKNLLGQNLFSLGGSAIRHWYAENSLNDLNRSMNTVFVYSAFSLGVTYQKILKEVKWKIISILLVSISLLMFLLTGSRQNLIAFIIYLTILNLLSINKKYFLNNFITKLIKMISIIIVFIIIIIYMININVVDINWIQKRFLSFFLEQQITTGDEYRIFLAQNAISSSISNSGFGVGPGNLQSAHNGYLFFIGENGIILGGIALILIYMLIIKTMLKVCNNNNSITIIMWALFIVVALFLTNVKDLFREPIFWSLLGVSIGFSLNTLQKKNLQFKSEINKV